MQLNNLNFAKRWSKDYFLIEAQSNSESEEEEDEEEEEKKKEEEIIEILQGKGSEEIEDKDEENYQRQIKKVIKKGNKTQPKKKKVKFKSLVLIS